MQEHNSNIIIEARNLGKSYRIFANPKDRLKQALWGSRKQYFREFWALREVDFSIARGQSLGIIGKNGSGKSTLLQMICGTLTPTEGYVVSRGRIAALLELGSGFNPEFTGMENIYLCSLLLGLSKSDTERRLDDILAFADIGDFVYQPIKTYSSGMVVRLAFAVIANSDPDILVVDEALSVGDIFFTQKCMRFIQRFREEHTLLFVSHDSASVTSLCDSAILLSEGRVMRMGSPKHVTEEYIGSVYIAQDKDTRRLQTRVAGMSSQPTSPQTADANAWIDYRSRYINSTEGANLLFISKFDESILDSDAFGNGDAEITNVILLQAETGKPLHVGMGGERVILRIEGIANQKVDRPIIGFVLKDGKGQVLLGDNTANSLECLTGENIQPIQAGDIYQAGFEFTMPLLPKGKYSITAGIANGTMLGHTQLQWLTDALIFESSCTSIAAGLAGVAMHKISLTLNPS